MNEPAEQHCLNCGNATLGYRQCKIQCSNCGFLLDCSDLDIGNEVKQAHLTQQREMCQAGGEKATTS